MWTLGRARGLGEAGLLLGLLVLLLVGTLTAQQRQVPPRLPLDVLGVLLLIGVVIVLAGRTRWPRSAFALIALATGLYLVPALRCSAPHRFGSPESTSFRRSPCGPWSSR